MGGGGQQQRGYGSASRVLQKSTRTRGVDVVAGRRTREPADATCTRSCVQFTGPCPPRPVPAELRGPKSPNCCSTEYTGGGSSYGRERGHVVFCKSGGRVRGTAGRARAVNKGPLSRINEKVIPK